MNKLQLLNNLELKSELYAKLGETVVDILERELGVDLTHADFKMFLGFINVIDVHVQSQNIGFMEILKDGGVDGVLTETVYQNYLDYMDTIGGNQISKTMFSRLIKKLYGYESELRHIPELGKTQRVYIYVGNEE